MSEDPTKNLPASQNGTLEQILAAVRSLESRLQSLESKVEERLYDTRPIWEKVEADIARLQEGQQHLEEGQQRLDERLQRFDDRLEALRDETRTGWRNLKRQFGVLHETFLEVRADYKDLDKRLYRLEEPLEEPHT
jgi:chromosome segregation ATPase